MTTKNPRKNAYIFKEATVKLLDDAARAHFIDKTFRCYDAFILHNPDLSPILVLKFVDPDGNEHRLNHPFFEE